MGEFPFQLSIKCASTNKEESLTCTALLRVISGSREVYEALWDGQDVIVKVEVPIENLQLDDFFPGREATLTLKGQQARVSGAVIHKKTTFNQK